MTLRCVPILFLAVVSLTAGSKRIIPNIQVQVDNARTAGGPVKVTLFTRKAFGFNYKEVESVTVDRAGRAYFGSRKWSKLGWLSLAFTWQPANLPERTLVYEIRATKGKKVSGGRSLNLGKDKAMWVIENRQGGDCGNLFSYSGDQKSMSINFTVPDNFLACQDPGRKFADMSQIGSREINKGRLNYFKFDDDQRMGQQFKQELPVAENPPLKDGATRRYVQNLIDRIGKASDMADLKFQVEVIDADVVNAFAVPGGYIWVYRGLIEKTETEAELVGVLAHEIAHVTSRHGTEGMTSAINKVALATAANEVLSESTDKKWIAELISTTVLSGTQFWIMGGTRKREAEADRLGAQYAYRAGYDPRGIASLFDRWSKEKGGTHTRLDQFFSDHPSDEARVAMVTQEVGYFMPPKNNLITSSREYEQIKRRLAKMPRPKASGQVAAQALFSSFAAVNQGLLIKEIGAYLTDPAKPKDPNAKEEEDMP